MAKEQENKQENKPEAKPEKKKSVNVNMSGLKETLINYIVPIISLAITALVGLFVLMPSYKNIPELESQLAQKTGLEANLRSKLNNMNRLVDFESVVEENSDLINKVLVSEELVPGLLTQIDRISKESGFEVTRLNYGLGTAAVGTEEAGAISYEVVTVNLGVTGTYTQLQTFFNSLENAARLINVNNFRYATRTNESALGITFVLVSPYLYVESSAVTDDPIDLDISDAKFIELINSIKKLRYYDPYEVDVSIPVVEAPPEGEEVAEGEQPPVEQPPVETPAEQPVPEQPAADSIFPQ